MSRRSQHRAHSAEWRQALATEQIAAALQRLAPRPIYEQGSTVEAIALVIHEFDKTLTRPPVDRAPLSQSQREILAGMIFERLFKEE